jgi:F-type H+-transporting ATPase subunit b
VHTAVTVIGERVEVRLVAPAGTDEDGEGEETASEEEAHEEVPESDLNPIAPEPKELLWGFGSFVVLALLMRYVLYPRLRKGIDARYALIRAGHEEADQITAAAEGDAAEYESQLAAVKAEAAARIDAARSTLEGERNERLAAVNARIAERRAAAAAELEQARAAAEEDVESAVREVAAAAGRLATGRDPGNDVVAESVRDVMSVGATR